MRKNDDFVKGGGDAETKGKSSTGYEKYDSTFKNASKAFERLNNLTPDLSDEKNIDKSLRLLILSAWSSLDRMKKLQDEIATRLQEAKKIAGLVS
ncbi:MAG: hypothetical protein HQK89_04540 [Nitrospirae bacterium]|nr:hypothetical protein [Nitrospirota bacterium]